MAASVDRTEHFPGGNLNEEQSMVVCVESQEPQWTLNPSEVPRLHPPNTEGSAPHISSLKVSSRELVRNETTSRPNWEGRACVCHVCPGIDRLVSHGWDLPKRRGSGEEIQFVEPGCRSKVEKGVEHL